MLQRKMKKNQREYEEQRDFQFMKVDQKAVLTKTRNTKMRQSQT